MMQIGRNIVLFFSLFLVFSCAKDEPIEQVLLPEDLSQYERDEGVMMQGFYWDIEPRGEWWNNLSTKLENWKKIGVDRIWLPPASKGQSGGYSMGYDPMDYFDFGQYDQMGTIKTRFGSKAELETLIAKAHNVGIEVIADIVLNHNSGGELQFNPFRNKDTYTLFQPKSGMFPRNYNSYHPNDIHDHDEEALFFAEQDVCHLQPDIKKWFWESDSSVAKYYKNTMKFDGWRFDYVKGFAPWVVKAWIDAVGGFSVLEVWDGNTDYLKYWVDNTGAKAFDFALFYNLEQAIDGNNMNILSERNALWKVYPDKAVTFVNNHDTEKETSIGNRITPSNRLLAYAYIMTHEGYPCVFYSDYESVLSKTKLEKLIQIKRSLAIGETNVLHVDNETYIAQRRGEGKIPGLVVAINNSLLANTKPVYTQWKNAILYDFSENTDRTLKTDENGRVNIETSAKSYTIWSLKKF